MRGWWVPAVLALLAAGLAAQGANGNAAQAPGGGRFGRGGQRGTPPPNPNADVVNDLYRQARQAITNVSTLTEPRMLADLAGDEQRDAPDQAETDMEQAFRLAVALRPPNDPNDATDVLGLAREQLKAQVELRGVTELARGNHVDDALALARLADVPKGPLYDVLIESAGGGGGRGGRGRGATADAASAEPLGMSRMDEVYALVQECKRADGTYPYRGVAMALRGRGTSDDVLDRMTLVRDGYQWAGGETDPEDISQAVFFLQAGHRAEPELDGMLSSTIVALVSRLAGANSTSADAGAARSSSSRLLSLLQQFDPGQATVLAAAFPAASAGGGANPAGTIMLGNGSGGGMLSGGGGQGGGAGTNLQFAFGNGGGSGGQLSITMVAVPQQASVNTDPNAAATADPSVAQQFRSLLSQAEAQQRRNATEALRLANQAAGLLDDTLLNQEMEAAGRLAALYEQLSDVPDAMRLLGRCLDAADAQGLDADAQFAAADNTALAPWAAGDIPNESAVLAAYSMAARLDFPLAAQRAEATPFVQLKPAALARVALVGELGTGRGAGMAFSR